MHRPYTTLAGAPGKKKTRFIFREREQEYLAWQTTNLPRYLVRTCWGLLQLGFEPKESAQEYERNLSKTDYEWPELLLCLRSASIRFRSQTDMQNHMSNNATIVPNGIALDDPCKLVKWVCNEVSQANSSGFVLALAKRFNEEPETKQNN